MKALVYEGPEQLAIREIPDVSPKAGEVSVRVTATGICIAGLNVKVCGSGAGLSDYGDGATHRSIDDIALMRTLPHMQVFTPADANQTRQIVTYMAKNKGPMYLRLNRNGVADKFGVSALNYEQLLERYGFTAERFAAEIESLMA